MPQPTYSSIFGGRVWNGDAAAVGDCIIPVGGKGERLIIENIIATYGFTGADYDTGGGPPDGLRSFIGRLAVVEGILNQEFSDLVTNPNPILLQRFENQVMLDLLIHDFRRPTIINLPRRGSYGVLEVPSEGATVILIRGNAYTPAGAVISTNIQMLHVSTSAADEAQFQIGERVAID